MSLSSSLLCLALAGAALPPTEDPTTLEKALREIDSRRDGSLENAARLERECLLLLQGPRSALEKGLLRKEMAFLYHQASPARADKVLEHGALALEAPLPLQARAELHLYRADAYEIRDFDPTRGPGAEVCPDAVAECLAGLRELLAQPLPDAKPELPQVDPIDVLGEPGTPEHAETLARQRAQLERRAEALRIEALVELRDLLLQKCARLCPKGTSRRDELELAAAERLPSEAARGAFRRLLERW